MTAVSHQIRGITATIVVLRHRLVGARPMSARGIKARLTKLERRKAALESKIKQKFVYDLSEADGAAAATAVPHIEALKVSAVVHADNLHGDPHSCRCSKAGETFAPNGTQ